MRRRKAALAVIVITGLLGWAWASRSQDADTEVSAEMLCTARRGDLPITVTESGFLKAKESVKISTKFEGNGKISWLIDEGKQVVEGDILVEFDKTELENSIDDLQNKLIQYNAELEAAKANLQIQERDGAAGIDKARLKTELARMTLEKYEQGEAPNELRKLALAVEKAKSEFDRAKERFEQVPELMKEGFLTKIQVEEERIKLREAEINQENAVRDHELYTKYTQVMETTQKQSDLKDAERELENSVQKATISLQITATQKRLEKQQKELTYMTMKAPSAGTVHYGDPDRSWYREELKLGNSVWQGQTVITLPDLKDTQAIVQVHEADIDLIEEGLDVNVTVETHKGQNFPGKVTKIATVASSRNSSDAANKTFKVEITLDPHDAELRAGVTARAEIQVEVLSDVLKVPLHAVIAEGGNHFSFVQVEGVVERREVTIGKHNAHFVEVLAGLQEGDQVLLYDPRDGDVHSETEDSEEEEEGPGLSEAVAATDAAATGTN